jgi:sec-independent protein translocase protein TatA
MGFGTQELIIILLIVVLLFGAKKIPELAKGMGKGIKEFKSAMNEEEEKKEEPKEIAQNSAETAEVETKKSENA